MTDIDEDFSQREHSHHSNSQHDHSHSFHIHSHHSDVKIVHTKDEKREPWELDDLLEKHSDAGDDDDVHKKKKTWKTYAKIILPHVGLTLLSCIYIVGGAIIMYHLEKPNELDTRSKKLSTIADQRREFLERMWVLSLDSSEEKFRQEAFKGIEKLAETLFEAFDTQFIKDDHLNDNNTSSDTWTFTNAIFFTSTLLTTIGYGNLVPVTFYGRMFCICYGLLGVPLVLITVADLGKFLSEHIIWLYGRYQEYKKSFRARCYGRFCPGRERRRRQRRAQEASDAAAEMLNPDHRRRKSSSMGVNDAFKELGKYGLQEMAEMAAIPVSLILLFLMSYIVLGAVLMSTVEDWPLFDAFYFSFITMTTIGFGDLVPEKEEYFFIDLLYIIVGLAVTTMCIDLVGIQYITKIHYFGRAIQDARFALVNVGGKMVQVGDLVKYAAFLHRKYGIQDPKIKIIENPVHMNPFPDAFTPKAIKFIPFIDYMNGGADTSSLHSFTGKDDSDLTDTEHDPGDTTYRISTWDNV